MSKQDWERSHRRYRLVTEIVERPDLLTQPLDAALVAEFGSREKALLAVHRRWVSVMRGCLDVELEIGAYTSSADALTRVARRAVAHAPALHQAITELQTDPVMAVLEDHFHLRLAQTIGIGRPASRPRDAVREVRRIIARAAAVESVPGSRRRWPLPWLRRGDGPPSRLVAV